MAELASLAERGRIGAEGVAHLLNHSRLEEPTVDDFVAAGMLQGRLRKAGRKKVSLVDCIAYQVARRLGAPYLTRDQDLAGLPGVLSF